ncbi:MAG: 3-dehydroquinate synthase [Rhodospirillaceae bacterium]|nr:3-dehydroquinate synthase [Rhodospirillaceae bacterium]
MTETVRVSLGPRSYDIHIAPGVIGRAGALMRPLMDEPRAVVITDDRVGPLYGERLTAALASADIRCDTLTVPAGEATKSWAQAGETLERLLALGVDRKTTVVALGGGVVGDLAGFLAAVALRGLPFVQVPTTLLAQVDSSVGGKTGVNSQHGKNLIGAFHQPATVLIDIDTLATLPERQLLAGYAEVAKYGLIDRPDFFAWLETAGPAVVAGDRAALTRAIVESVAAKAEIVGADERESGARALLNLGHTFGHALEAAAGFGDRLLHGEAVAIGMVMAFDTSVAMGLCPPEDAARVRRHLAAMGLPVRPPPDLADRDGLMALMAKDKKTTGGRLTFILAEGIGRAVILRDVEPARIAATLDQAA